MLTNSQVDKIRAFFEKFPKSNFKKKDLLMQPDQPSSFVYFIESGYIKSYKITEEGDELTLIILKPGDFFPFILGGDNLFNNCYVEALGEVEVFKAPIQQFLNLIKEDTHLYFKLTSDILNRFSWLITRMEYLITGRAYTKVVSTMLIFAQDFGVTQGTDIIVRIPLTHKDIATLAGITRETTCLEMRKLEKKGLIKRMGRFFVIKNIRRLQQESDTSTTAPLPL